MNFIGPWSDYLPEGIWPLVRNGSNVSMRKLSTTAGFPIPIDELMLDLRIDSTDEEATVKRMARAAGAFLEKRTGLAVVAGRYEALFNNWCFGPWEFLRSPLRTMVEVSWLDGSTGSAPSWTEMELSDFFVSRLEKSFLLAPLQGTKLPAVWAPFHGIRVRFDAGYDVELTSGESSGDQVSESDADLDQGDLSIPDDVRTTLTMLTNHYYENRDLFLAGKIAQVEVSAGNLLTANRMFW